MKKRTTKQKIISLLLLIPLLIFSGMELLVFLYYLDNFINGFTPTDLVGTQLGAAVYGFRAVAADAWAHLVFFPVINAASLFQFIFLCWKIRKKPKGKYIGIVVGALALGINVMLWFWLLV